MVSYPSLTETILSIEYLAMSLIGSMFVVMIIPIIYEKLSVYHYLESEAEDRSDLEVEDCEPFREKVLWVFIFNLVSILLLVAFLYPLQSKEIGVSLMPRSLFMISFLSAVIHGSIRVSAFVDLGYLSGSNEHIRRIRDRLIGFGFSLMLSTYFLTLVTIGIWIVTDDIGSLITFKNKSQINLVIALGYLILTLGSIFTISYWGEYILAKWGVKDCLKSRC